VAIRAYKPGGTDEFSAGDWTDPVDCGNTVVGGLSSSVPVLVACDPDEERNGPYTIGLAGDYPDRYRLGVNGVDWLLGWGAALSLPGPITEAPTTIYVQKRAILGDPHGAGSTPACLSLPQDGLSPVASLALPGGVDTGLSADGGVSVALRLLGGVCTGEGADTGATPSTTASDLPSGADTGIGTEQGTPGLLKALGIGVSAGTSDDTGLSVALLVLTGSDTGLATDTGNTPTSKPTLGQVGTVAASNGNGESVLDWPDLANATGYTVEYKAGATEPADWSGASSTTSATSGKTVGSLTNGTKYWFRVKGTAAGYTDGAWSTAVSATPAAASLIVYSAGAIAYSLSPPADAVERGGFVDDGEGFAGTKDVKAGVGCGSASTQTSLLSASAVFCVLTPGATLAEYAVTVTASGGSGTHLWFEISDLVSGSNIQTQHSVPIADLGLTFPLSNQQFTFRFFYAYPVTDWFTRGENEPILYTGANYTRILVV